MRHLKRVASWRQGHDQPLDEEAVRKMELYFKEASY